MTKVMLNIDKLNGIYFECINHADDHDACRVMSTLCNVLVEACFRNDSEPTIYNSGHVRIDMPYSDKAYEVFAAVEAVIKDAKTRYPDFIKIY